MDQKIRFWCPWEARRMLWIMGMIFAVAVLFQHFELPYGNFLSSLSSAHKDLLGRNSNRSSSDGISSSPEVVNNLTRFDGLNSSGPPYDTHGSAVDDGEGKAADGSDGMVSQKTVELNNSSGIDNAEDDFSPEKLVDINVSSALDAVNSFANGSIPEKIEQEFSKENITSTSENAGDLDSGLDSQEESLPEHLVGTNINSTLDGINNSVNGHTSEEMERSFSEGNATSISENRADLDLGSDNQVESLPEDLVETSINSTLDNDDNSANGPALEGMEQSFLERNTTSISENTGNSDAGTRSTVPVLPPIDSSPTVNIPKAVESDVRTPVVPVDPKTFSVNGDATPTLANDGKSGELQNNVATLHDDSSVVTVPKVKKMRKKPNRPEVPKIPGKPTPAVISISEMNNMLLQSWSSPHPKRPGWSSAGDQELLNARSQIENAPTLKNDPILYAPLYRNVSMFKRSYELMESTLKVYIYKEGERPILHKPLLLGIYASEGWFMKLLEANRKFVTKKPRKAHLFYLPFGSRNLEESLYVPNSHSHKNLVRYLKNYLDIIAAKYPFWNRTQGADHFLVACHDWAPSETREIMANCIRALCNADPREGFIFGKDASLPETFVRTSRDPLRDLGGKPSSQRRILAFFAGSMHGYLRTILLQHWENKDPDMKIFGRLPRVKGKNDYARYMKSSKYCICAKGYEVNSPRVVEAIFYECVPVILSDNFVPPFFEVLNWESFAVFVLEKDIPNLKSILLSIPEKRFRQMQMRVKLVQKHFLWHPKPVKYDIFHMILHSVWYNRVFQMQA